MHLRGTGYALIASLMFGFGVVLAKLLSGEIDAVLVAFLSLSIGGLLLTTYLLFTGNSIFRNLSMLNRADWINIFLLSCIGTALPLLFIVAGFTHTSALVGGFILQLNGMAALIFALLLLHERFRLRQGLGILLLLVGSMLVVLKGSQGGVDWNNGSLGNLLILAGAIGLGFGFIPAKRLSERVETLQLTALRLLLGAATLLPIVAISTPLPVSIITLATHFHQPVGAPCIYSHQFLSGLSEPASRISFAQSLGNGYDHANCPLIFHDICGTLAT